jgi:hypothetical protein
MTLQLTTEELTESPRPDSHRATRAAVGGAMRVKRARKVRKYLRYYRTCHGFRAPYKVRPTTSTHARAPHTRNRR